MSTHTGLPEHSDLDLDQLRGDCARMVAHWSTPAEPTTAPVAPSLIHGVRVPSTSARMLDQMSDYGD
ncbi:hypothetical protein DY218_26640 [Streptomyces triticagri]|uniref:Uncharacterized protein n=1 Tax=Streptomyces triticagri TaxID=2293568 RepID=A0A372LZP6_9ACTN|nr:hypothetical protein [Streptomyces triticagri]RFU83497.1 hypothetical protein DY218_26640 [Streptomyces triticagri]